ncbi:hypothetical protein Bbelb_228840 [Branchiostoma belcheri]|nr:hypothetical protein Bbelb_228840 [Branchiostoma belcheri]
MPTCEDCHAPGAQLGQGDRNLCKRCSDKRSPPVDSPQGQGEPNKIFINDLLCFVVNKMDKMPGDIVTKLCLETYSEEEIEVAKKLTFDTCKPSEQFRKRYSRIWRSLVELGECSDGTKKSRVRHGVAMETLQIILSYCEARPEITVLMITSR